MNEDGLQILRFAEFEWMKHKFISFFRILQKQQELLSVPCSVEIGWPSWTALWVTPKVIYVYFVWEW